MANIWDGDEKVSEFELIAEDAKEAEALAEEYALRPPIAEASDEVLEEIAEESSFNLNRSESNVIYNARLRLEQAKLYEMLINHNLFDGVEASPEAISNVQNELKFYIVKRLEILLGIREPVIKEQVQTADPSLNDVELDFLKQLAYKGTVGASATGKPTAPRSEKQSIKPLTGATSAPKLKSLASKEVTTKQNSPVPTQQVKKTANPAPQAPVKKQVPAKTALKIRESGLGRNLTPAEAEAIAREDLKNLSKKEFKDMNAKEKAARIREVNEKHKRPSSPNAKPMPSANELEMKYRNQESQRSSSKNQSDQFNLMLANALAVQKNRGEDNE
jgi:hypothetical protein